MDNRSQMVVTGDENYTTSYTYDANNRLLTEAKTEADSTVTTSYTYDANGNTLTISTPANGENEAVTKAYSYNRFNQQISVLTNDVPTAQYTYNAQGIRTSKTVSAEQTNFLLDGGNVVAEIQGDATTNYLRGINLISKTVNSAADFYLFNAHGDVVNLVNSTGATTKTYDYDAFGNERSPDEADENPFRYCGEYYDTETGTYYLRARYYDPLLGRFTTEDPALAGLNWYTYCANNPIAYADPLGLDAILISKKLEFEAAEALGIEHMGAFFQDENGIWYYFYWGEVVIYEPVTDPSIFESLDTMNAWLYENGYLEESANPYTDSIYVVGDFSKSHQKASAMYEKLKDEGPGINPWQYIFDPGVFKNPRYDLFANNCGQVTMQLFRLGILPSGLSVDTYLDANFVFTSPVPNFNMEQLHDVFYNSALNRTQFDQAMAYQRSKYEGRNLLVRLWYSWLRNNISAITGN